MQKAFYYCPGKTYEVFVLNSEKEPLERTIGQTELVKLREGEELRVEEHLKEKLLNSKKVLQNSKKFVVLCR